MIELSMAELRGVAGYAVACAEPALAIFERVRPDDPRPVPRFWRVGELLRELDTSLTAGGRP